MKLDESVLNWRGFFYHALRRADCTVPPVRRRCRRDGTRRSRERTGVNHGRPRGRDQQLLRGATAAGPGSTPRRASRGPRRLGTGFLPVTGPGRPSTGSGRRRLRPTVDQRTRTRIVPRCGPRAPLVWAACAVRRRPPAVGAARPDRDARRASNAFSLPVVPPVSGRHGGWALQRPATVPTQGRLTDRTEQVTPARPGAPILTFFIGGVS